MARTEPTSSRVAPAFIKDNKAVQLAPELCAAIGLAVVRMPSKQEAELLGRLLHAQDFAGNMKSITGTAEWDLARLVGDILPDGTVPMWRPGFEALRTAGRMAAKSAAPGSTTS